MAGGRLHLGMQDGALFETSSHMVECIDIDVIHTQIRSTEIFVVAGHFHALDVGTEIPLRNASQPFQIELICDRADAAVIIANESTNKRKTHPSTFNKSVTPSDTL